MSGSSVCITRAAQAQLERRGESLKVCCAELNQQTSDNCQHRGFSVINTNGFPAFSTLVLKHICLCIFLVLARYENGNYGFIINQNALLCLKKDQT